MYVRSSRRVRLGSLLVAVAALASCSSEPGVGTGAANTSSAANRSAANTAPAVPGGMPGNMPAPMGMEDSIEGRVVSVICLERTPDLPPAEAKKCAEELTKTGGPLAVLASDGTLYINDEEADTRKTNKQLEFFIGEEVTIQGQVMGAAKRPMIGKTPVKQFRMKLVRRKVMTYDGPGAGNMASGK